MARILLTHSPETRENYYGPRALAGLRALGDVKLNETDTPLEGQALIDAARDCDLVVSYRQSPAPAELFASLPRLVAFLRCAIDIRNVDVAAASTAGVLVTQASAGFVASVSELVFALMIDLARGVTRAAETYRAGEVPHARMGGELAGATLGVIGYGAIGRRVAELGRAFAMRVLVTDPYAKVDAAGFALANVDATVVAQVPRLGPHREAMESQIAELLGAGEGRVNLKVTSTDHLGFVGREEGIAALAVVLLVKAEAGA